MILNVNSDHLNNINHLILVTVKCAVLFEVRTELFNTIYTSFGFKELIKSSQDNIRVSLKTTDIWGTISVPIFRAFDVHEDIDGPSDFGDF
jgi:hypothetical protein